MEVNGVVRISDFMNHLKENNLVIAHKKDVEVELRIADIKLRQTQQKYLKQDGVKIGAIIKYKLTHWSRSSGPINAYKDPDNHIIKPGEMYKDSKGHWMLTTTAIKRIRKEKNL